MTNNELYEKYRVKYGQPAQLQKACEELAELTVELMHLNFNRGSMLKLIDEVADVSIMIDQIKYLYTIGQEVDDRVYEKLNRMESRLHND